MAGYLSIVLSVFAAATTYGLFKLLQAIYWEWSSPLRVLQKPPSPSLLYGNMKEIGDADAQVLHEKWVQEYGHTITYKAFFGQTRLYTVDPKALNHMLMNSSIYQKPELTRYFLDRVLGRGVLVVEGEKHKQQRKVMNPAFGAAQIRELTEIFVDKSIELRDVWAEESAKPESNGTVDVLSGLSKMTLDVIGLAGFNYKFNALSQDPSQNELNQAFNTIFGSVQAPSILPLIRAMFPALRWIPETRDKQTRHAKEMMNRIGEKLLSDSKAAILADNGKFDKASWKSKDLLSLLLQANMSADVPAHQRMNDADVLAQVPTFLVAGHETTSSAVTWALFALTQAPDVQAKLREEVSTISTDNPTMDELNSLPYLDAVVRETLRIHAPVPSTIRVAAQDDVLPLGTPVRGRNGELIEHIKVRAGQTILIPILSMNRDKALWGPDGDVFNPDRWIEKTVPQAASSVPGVWGNMMTFLGGPRACIGFRFSLVETKALLFTLIRAFEFELAVPPEDIIKKSSVVQRPVVKSQMEKGNQMPLRITPVQRGF